MSRWSEFELAAPEFAAAGRRLLVGADGIAIGFLATAASPARPHIAPVCPVFGPEALYLSAAAGSPKARDLRENGGFALHAFLGANDEEFQLAGRAAEVLDADERRTVHAAIPFPAYKEDDPLFRLDPARALWVYWERVGTPETRAVRRRWPALRLR